MNYIDQSGNTFLIINPPTEEEIQSQGTSMNHGTDFTSAVHKGREIPLWWDEEYRISQVYTGHGFQIRQAEYSEELNELITLSTVVGDGDGWGKVNGTLPNPDLTYYAIHRHSVEDGSRTATWDFSNREWSEGSMPSAFKVLHTSENAFNQYPSLFRQRWENASEDFPDFFDKTTGLKRNISLNSDSPSTPSSEGEKKSEVAQDDTGITITAPSKFNKRSSDKITNFNPSTDTLEIDANSFGIDSSATFASGKNKKEVKKKLAKQDFDFLYDEKKGGLYFNENGADKGFGNGGIIAILKGAPDLTASNLEFI